MNSGVVMQNCYALEKIQEIISSIFTDNLHEKRQLSLSYAALGLVASGSLFLHMMGAGMAQARGVDKKHATKQIDRLLSNKGYDIWELSASWVPYVLAEQKDIIVALDWSSFADDAQHTVCLNVLTSKGCSTPLLWKTVSKELLKYNRARYEAQLLTRLRELLPSDVSITIVADRGFADHKFLNFIEHELKFYYLIRIKNNTLITNDKGETRAAKKWLRDDKKARNLGDVNVTAQHYAVKQFVSVHDKGMKDAWFLVTNRADLATRQLINLYAKRWKIEPYFRDIKDGRYGYGLSSTHIGNATRRDRLFLIVAISYMLLLLMGQAGEQLGFDRLLKVNTVKTRTHSLFTQSEFYLHFFHLWRDDKQILFLEQFQALLEQRGFWLAFFNNNK
jgi:hypothetical protein